MSLSTTKMFIDEWDCMIPGALNIQSRGCYCRMQVWVQIMVWGLIAVCWHISLEDLARRWHNVTTGVHSVILCQSQVRKGIQHKTFSKSNMQIISTTSKLDRSQPVLLTYSVQVVTRSLVEEVEVESVFVDRERRAKARVFECCRASPEVKEWWLVQISIDK